MERESIIPGGGFKAPYQRYQGRHFEPRLARRWKRNQSCLQYKGFDYFSSSDTVHLCSVAIEGDSRHERPKTT